MCGRIEIIGFLDPRLASPFLPNLLVFRAALSPLLFTDADHPLVSLALLQRLFSCHLPSVLPPRAPTFGSLPSSRDQRSESTTDGRSTVRLRSALRVSHPLDGFLLRAPCWLFIQLPRPGFSLQGFPPTRLVKTTRRRLHPSAPLATGPYHLAMAPAPVASTSRYCPI